MHVLNKFEVLNSQLSHPSHAKPSTQVQEQDSFVDIQRSTYRFMPMWSGSFTHNNPILTILKLYYHACTPHR